MDEITPMELASLADYFAKELPSGDIVAVERWINEQPGRKRLVRDLQLLRCTDVNSTANVLELPMRVAALSREFAEIRARERTNQASDRSSSIESVTRVVPQRLGVRTFPRPAWLYAVGAGFASMLLLFGGWNLAEVRYGVVSQSSVSTYTTGNGERATVTLPDGSTILLNVGSRLHVPSNYASGNRTVHLMGQALFTIASRSGAPFTVISGPSVTKVLGTRFVVRHYESDTTATVLVHDGKVAIGSTVLTAAQEVTVSADGNSEVRRANTSVLSFAQGVLTLNKMPLIAAIPDLNRWYNVDIRLGDPVLSDRQVAGGFKAGSPSDLVSILELMYEARVVREGRVLTLYPRE